MRRDLMDILVCPVGKDPLTLTVSEESDDEVLEGTLTCADGHSYSIEGGIPNLLPPERGRTGEASPPS